MFSNWSHKKRSIYFFSASFGLLVLGYIFGLSKTFALYQENNQLEDLNISARDLQSELAILASQKRKLDSILLQSNADGEDEVLLRQLSSVRLKGNQLAKYSGAKHRSTSDRYSVFRYQGNFGSLGRLLHFVETRNYGGAVSSVKFEVETDRRTKVSRLFMDMYFEK